MYYQVGFACIVGATVYILGKRQEAPPRAKSGAASPQIAAAKARVVYKVPVPTDIAVSQALAPLHIGDIARGAGILESELDYYGRTKAKVSLNVRERLKDSPDGNYVVVTGINPTPLVRFWARLLGGPAPPPSPPQTPRRNA